MGEFTADWLSVREPEDKAARNADVLQAVCETFATNDRIRILDVGSGTGSTLRSLVHEISNPQDWILADYDQALLKEAASQSQSLLSQSPHSARFLTCDLSRSFDILDERADLISTSAFLDLVSEEWLSSFVSALADRRLPFYGALSYNGHSVIEPGHAADGAVLSAFNHHQGSDKGFGPALGPNAAERAMTLFEAAGYKVTTGPSNWDSRAGERETSTDFQKLLLSGWAQAADDTGLVEKVVLSQWLTHRLAAIEAKKCRVIVGHQDIFAQID
ncbi:MAG: class I SAM-dependent methyltransferase [Stappiaceae bacterium]